MIRIRNDREIRVNMDVETVDIHNGVITEIVFEEDGVVRVKVEDGENEEESEMIPLEKYEAEINDLKDEITRLREMYQLEHLKALKLKNEPCRGMDSHHPTPNIYADDWRMP